MKYTINRCMKMPGLIDRARTYFLELNDKGLYIIAIGKAGLEPNIRQDNLTNIAAMAIAKKINSPIARKMEEEILTNEERLQNGKMEEIVREKKSYFLTTNDIVSFKTTNQGKTTKINIKGKGMKIELHVDNSYSDQISGISNALLNFA